MAPATTAAAGGKTPYDKDAVDVQLKRAARQIKAQLRRGDRRRTAQATGPWGTTKASVMLGRNGHVKQVTDPRPVRRQAGRRLRDRTRSRRSSSRRTPRPATSVLDWDIEIVKPAEQVGASDRMPYDYDLVVIGVGPAGEKGAAQAAYFGKRVAFVERAEEPGGAAVHTGTLPEQDAARDGASSSRATASASSTA